MSRIDWIADPYTTMLDPINGVAPHDPPSGTVPGLVRQPSGTVSGARPAANGAAGLFRGADVTTDLTDPAGPDGTYA